VMVYIHVAEGAVVCHCLKRQRNYRLMDSEEMST
jgi:hypothetical protein